jgi:phage shock protein PspC (stress-responsive transcriptional regulator)
MPYATYRFNKIIAAETIRFIVTVAIVVYKGLKLVVYRMLTLVVDSYKVNK